MILALLLLCSVVVFAEELVVFKRDYICGRGDWLGRGKSLQQCREAIAANSHKCSQTFFNYVARGDRNCGCVAHFTDCRNAKIATHYWTVDIMKVEGLQVTVPVPTHRAPPPGCECKSIRRSDGRQMPNYCATADPLDSANSRFICYVEKNSCHYVEEDQYANDYHVVECINKEVREGGHCLDREATMLMEFSTKYKAPTVCEKECNDRDECSHYAQNHDYCMLYAGTCTNLNSDWSYSTYSRGYTNDCRPDAYCDTSDTSTSIKLLRTPGSLTFSFWCRHWCEANQRCTHYAHNGGECHLFSGPCAKLTPAGAYNVCPVYDGRNFNPETSIGNDESVADANIMEAGNGIEYKLLFIFVMILIGAVGFKVGQYQKHNQESKYKALANQQNEMTNYGVEMM